MCVLFSFDRFSFFFSTAVWLNFERGTLEWVFWSRRRESRAPNLNCLFSKCLDWAAFDDYLRTFSSDGVNFGPYPVFGKYISASLYRFQCFLISKSSIRTNRVEVMSVGTFLCVLSNLECWKNIVWISCCHALFMNTIHFANSNIYFSCESTCEKQIHC